MTDALERLREAVRQSGSVDADSVDDHVSAFLREFAGLDPAERGAVRRALGRDVADTLQGWGAWRATVAVRERRREDIVWGLLALSLTPSLVPDEREALLVVPLHRRAAQLIGADARAVFDEAAALADDDGADWLTELRDTSHTPADMDFVEDVDDDGQFMFWPRDLPKHVHERNGVDWPGVDLARTGELLMLSELPVQDFAFPVLAPTRAERDWDFEVWFDRDRQIAALCYGFGGWPQRTSVLRVVLARSATSDGLYPDASAPSWEPVAAGDGSWQARGPTKTWPYCELTLTIDDVYVALMSPTFGRARLAELAGSLAPLTTAA